MPECYVGLGANLGDPHRALCDAAGAMDRLPQTRLVRLSRIYRSAPVGPAKQPEYLNAVVALHTALGAHELLAALQGVETAAGRQRGERWGPRTLDLDLLLFGDERIGTPTLTVPHPRIAERNFVLAPLIDVAGGDYRIDGRALTELLRLAPSNGLVALPLSWGAGTAVGA